MSEKIFACLLRLYPSQFREKYTEEAMQLVRDLYRQESGLLRRTCLWIGLVTDLVRGLPRAYQNTYVSTAASPVAQVLHEGPAFSALEQEPIRPGLFLLSSVLTLALLGVLTVVLNHPDAYPAPDASNFARSPILAVIERLHQPDISSQFSYEPQEMDGGIQNDKRYSQLQDANPFASGQELAETQMTLNSKTPASMQQYETRGASNTAAEGTVSSARLTPYQQPVTRNAQEEIAHYNSPIPLRSGALAPSVIPYQATAKLHNCFFETTEALLHNIGYIKLDSFPNAAICGAGAREAMNRLNDADAIIFDLRENRGGDPEMAEEIAAWLFAHPAAWYNPGERSAAQSKTLSPVANSKLAGKPVFILTSSQTAASAELFVYNLKMLRRATVIGERTRGEIYVNPFERNADHHGIPMKPLVNPNGKPDWKGTGIAPDVEVNASGALLVAEKYARGGRQVANHP
jgi:hypothetical protein